MYPHFIEVHNVDNGKPVSVNVSAITYLFRYEGEEGEETNIELNTCQYVNTKETYEEIKALIKGCGCLIHKADPRLDTEHPLTMEDLKTMVGEPVWNSNTLDWWLIHWYQEDYDEIIVYNNEGVQESWDEKRPNQNAVVQDEAMTREEAIAYLEDLSESPDMCYTCGQCGGLRDEDCKLREVIAWINRPLGERLIEVLREVRGE